MERRDEGLARAMVRPALVLLLAEGDAHGYALFTALRRLGLPLSDVGAVYKALKGLEEGRLVSSRWDTRVRRGPSRRVYRLTAKGERELTTHEEQLRMQRQVISRFLRRHRQSVAGGDGRAGSAGGTEEGPASLESAAG